MQGCGKLICELGVKAAFKLATVSVLILLSILVKQPENLTILMTININIRLMLNSPRKPWREPLLRPQPE